MTQTPTRNRIAFVGAGHVGATAAYAIMLRALFEEIILIDSDPALAKAEAVDLSDANALARPTSIRAGTYADAATADIVVLTAGAASHGNETRLSLAARSAKIVAECAGELKRAGFAGVLIVASNPVDLMTVVALRHSGLSPERVIGTGTLLDTNRLRQALAHALDIAPGAIEGFVLGEHGDSEVVAFSTVRVGGLSLDAFAGDARPDLPALAASVRDAGYDIIAGKGYTSFGIATAIVRICEAIIRDERVVLPVSNWLDGTMGISGLCLSLPCVLGAGGVVRVLPITLNEVEMAALHASADVLRSALAGLDRN